MSKELEALNKIQHDFGQLKGQELVKCYETIFNGLKRLEAIDNANPSEALNITKATEKYTGIDLSIVKQALIKAQEQEKENAELRKILSIVKEKRIDLESFYITFIEKEYHYNYYKIMYGTYGKFKLTQQEFDLLKRWLG